MLECKNISIQAGEKKLFNCPELSISEGLYALVGRNGAGKSTFLNVLLGEIEPIEGSVTLNGQKVSDYRLNDLAKKISIVRAKPVLFGDYSVREILLLGRLPYQNLLAKSSAQDLELINETALEFGITDYLDSEYNLLSDGEKQLCMVARAFVQDTPVILLDEPSAFLDLVNKKELLKKLKRLTDAKSKLIIFSTHHIEVLGDYCDGILLIHNHQLKLLNQPEKFQHEIEQAFGLKA